MVTKEGLELKGVAAASSIYEAVDLLPGVSMEATDPYGLGKKNTRFRGIKGMFGSITVEGMPNYGIMPIGPRESTFDTENVRSVSLFQGASPTALGTGNGNKGGSIELYFRRPEESPGIEFRQALGTDNFSRTFLRLDSGNLDTGTGLFASYSYTNADKWKGPGELGPRNHVDAGFTQKLGAIAELDGFFSYNDADQDSFRSLSYREAKALDDYYRLDYNEQLTGSPAQDKYYYRYNSSNAINYDYRFVIQSTRADDLFFSVKPYYANEDAWRTETITKLKNGKMNYFMLEKIRDLDRIGVIPEVRWESSPVSLTGGYWFESAGLDKYVKKSVITPTGLKDLGYSYYADNDGRGYVNSPYFKVSGQYEKIKWQAGMKYFSYSEPASTGYMTNPTGQLVQQPDIALDDQRWDTWLPSAGIGYNLQEDLEIYCNYGRTYVRPYMFVPITSLYVENRAKFNAAGMNLQDIFNTWDMETSDNIDVGLRFRKKDFSIHPVFFYSSHHDILVNAYDPTVGLNYYQNDGEAKTLGFELDTTAYLPWGVTLFFNPSYTNLEFSENLERNGSTVNIDGKQLPDTPKWLIKGGIIYSREGFEVTPVVTWMNKRYGDVLHQEVISGHTTVDLSIGYRRENLWQLRNVTMKLEFKNLFNSEHIGTIDLFDDGAAGATSYYSSAPFSTVFSLSVAL
jgi:iron complex outermembrane receptor protein